MIGLSGGYVASFNVGTYKDFIAEDLLDVFRIIEESGNVLPTFELIFSVKDSRVVQMLAEGCTLTALIGKDQNSMSNIRLTIVNRKKVRESVATQTYRVIGVFDAMPYMTDASVDSFKGTTFSLVKRLASKFFRFNTNISDTQDSMSWIQSNISSRAFVNKLWHHSFIDKDTMLAGICTDGVFRYTSLQTALKAEPSWFFSSIASSEKNSLTYDGDVEISSDSGFINYVSGYPKSRIIHNTSNQETNYHTPNFGPVMAVTKRAERSVTGRMISGISVQNGNMHEKYYEARDNNIRNLMTLNTLKAKVRFSNVYFPIRIHDVVVFKDDGSGRESSEDSSGLWIVSKVCRVISNRKFTTIVTLVRDGMNSVGSTE